MPVSKQSKPIETTCRSFEVIWSIQKLNGASVKELSDYMELPKSTIHRHLQTLEDLKAVVKEKGKYHIALTFERLGRHARERKRVYTLAEPVIRDLAEETEERVQLLVEEHGELVYVHRETGRRAVNADSHIGKRMEIHAAASGKAILAEYPVEQAREFIQNHELIKVGPNTITDEDEFMTELETVRERGYAFNREESIEGLHSIAVALTDPTGYPLGALCVTGPSHRLNGPLFTEELPNKLLGAASEIQLNHKYS